MDIRELEKILKALANRRRLAILRYLKKVETASVGEIAGEIKLTFKATSNHLRVLTALDLLEREQQGYQGMYRIAKEQKQVAQYIISLL